MVSDQVVSTPLQYRTARHASSGGPVALKGITGALIQKNRSTAERPGRLNLRISRRPLLLDRCVLNNLDATEITLLLDADQNSWAVYRDQPSRRIAGEGVFGVVRDEVEELLSGLPSHSDAYGAEGPSELAKQNLHSILHKIARVSTLAGWIAAPSAAGGAAAIKEGSDEREAVFECLNSGTCHLVLSTDDDDEVLPLPVEDDKNVADLIRRTLDFLS